jgi:adenylylsulfate kinase-like enzyme
MIYWFTGQPGHGKTVLSSLLKEHLSGLGKNVIQVDGDDIRKIFSNNDYSRDGRCKNITLAQQISKFCHIKGFEVIVSLVSPYREIRESFKEAMCDDILEFWVHTSEIRGREKFHVDDYEEPTQNYIEVDTTKKSPDETILEIVEIINIKNGKFISNL